MPNNSRYHTRCCLHPGSRRLVCRTVRHRNPHICHRTALQDFFSLQETQIRDTAHTKGVGMVIPVIVERATIQITVIVISAAIDRAWPYIVRVAVVTCRARAAAEILALQGTVTWIVVTELLCRISFRFRELRYSDTGQSPEIFALLVKIKSNNQLCIQTYTQYHDSAVRFASLTVLIPEISFASRKFSMCTVSKKRQVV